MLRSSLSSSSPKKLSSASISYEQSALYSRGSGWRSGARSSSSTAAVPQAGPPVMITTPIFYVNAPPHIGHLYTALLGDALARWKRMQGNCVLFLTGTDEHGQKISQAAKNANTSPELFCDQVSAKFRNLFQDANISFDTFIRTTEPRHKTAVHHLWKVLDQQKCIYEDRYEGWYCVSDEAFLMDAQVIEVRDPVTGQSKKVSAESGHAVQWVSESNFRFRLSQFRDPLLQWMNFCVRSNPEAIQPAARMSEMKAFLSGGLQDLSISRPSDRIPWGIRVPDRDDQTIYVWIDALTNYLTAAGYPESFSSSSSAVGTFWPPQYQLLGKDITRFHTIYWPAILLAAGLPLPKRFVAHAHWTVAKTKMSKSLGNIVAPADPIAKVGLDAVRYFLLREGGLESDGDYSEDALILRANSFLGDSFGNLVCRVTSSALNKAMVVPQMHPSCVGPNEQRLIDTINSVSPEVGNCYDRLDFRGALNSIAELCAQTNKYFTDAAPWTLQKNGEINKLNTVLYVSCDAVRVMALLLLPIMPKSAEFVLDCLGVPQNMRTAADLRGGRIIVGAPIVEKGLFFKKAMPPSISQTKTTKKAPQTRQKIHAV